VRIQVALINQSKDLDDANLATIKTALQHQVNQDFMPVWGVTAELAIVPEGENPPPGSWWLVFLDDSDQAGALGYHDLTPDLHPVSKVFVATDLKYGAAPSVTASHELLEMLGNPYLGDCVVDPRTGRLYAKENADAVEADEFGYRKGEVLVSDFVLPAFFDPRHRGKDIPLSFKGNVTEPFSLAKGGYLSYLELGNLHSGWQQVTAADERSEERGRRRSGFPKGSRRERITRASLNQLVVSTVHRPTGGQGQAAAA
jgi:hypothetical protein